MNWHKRELKLRPEIFLLNIFEIFPTELPCNEQPPPVLEGEGAERNYGPDITTYRCPNGYEWHNGQWPYLENECLNRKWSHKTLPPCKSELGEV